MYREFAATCYVFFHHVMGSTRMLFLAGGFEAFPRILWRFPARRLHRVDSPWPENSRDTFTTLDERKKNRRGICRWVFLNRQRDQSGRRTYEVGLRQPIRVVTDAIYVWTRELLLVDDHNQLQYVTSEWHIFTAALEERSNVYAHKCTFSFSSLIQTEGQTALAIARREAGEHDVTRVCAPGWPDAADG